MEVVKSFMHFVHHRIKKRIRDFGKVLPLRKLDIQIILKLSIR